MSPRTLTASMATAVDYRPATRPRTRTATRMLVVDTANGTLFDAQLDALPELLSPGDVVVVNDAATLPSAVPLRSREQDAGLELRLAEAPDARGRARAVLLGPGSWRQRTEDRPAPPRIDAGTSLWIDGAPELAVRVESVSTLSPRLLTVLFDGPRDRLDAALYRVARPIQYAYLEEELPLWAVQTAYAARPWAVEPASAGLGLSWSVLLSLRARGVVLATVTHAAGLSSTGDAAIDAALPLPERSELPASTVDAVLQARGARRRVVAVGTSVVRALEGRVADGGLVAGVSVTAHRLGPGTPRHIVDGLLTGMHAPGESHHALLGAFLEPDVLSRATAHAIARGYLAHELGDAMLVL